jgi:hypothetical protein
MGVTLILSPIGVSYLVNQARELHLGRIPSLAGNHKLTLEKGDLLCHLVGLPTSRGQRDGTPWAILSARAAQASTITVIAHTQVTSSKSSATSAMSRVSVV